MQIQDMDQNSFFSGKIDRESIQAWVNAHPQNSLYDKPTMLKTT